jgi:hypothetical protein
MNMPMSQILMLVAAGVFLVLYLARRRSRLKRDQ